MALSVCWLGELCLVMIGLFGTSTADFFVFRIFGSPEKDWLLVLKGLVTAVAVIFCHLARPLLPHY